VAVSARRVGLGHLRTHGGRPGTTRAAAPRARLRDGAPDAVRGFVAPGACCA
jgi:hypothetical protein